MTEATLPLSHSSATLLLECEQRYVYYKVDRIPPDLDHVKPDSLAVGSAFHYILEQSRHEKPASISKDLGHCIHDVDIGLSEDDAPLVHAMVLKYLRLHSRMGFKVLAVETELKTESFHGFIDAILEDTDGKWWIVDLKTYKSIHFPSLNALPKDPQLNLYAAHAALLADIHKLDIKKFGGCRWRVVTKSTAKQKANETLADYILRLADKHLTAYDIAVPKEHLGAEERLELHTSLWEKATALKTRKPIRNYKNCMSYYSPCAYFSRCHGKLFSEMGGIVQITEEE